MQEYWIGTTVLGFDGTVLEVFGSSDVHRHHLFHIQALKYSTARSGRRTFTVVATGGRGVVMLMLENSQHASSADALVVAVNQARAARGWQPVPTS